jgi:unsaturated rhamnogalacturonyl hydrolase
MRILALLLLSTTFATAQFSLHHWRAVADHLIQTPPESYPFNWGEGVQQIGLIKVHERTGDPRYADYLERWAQLFTHRDPRDLLDIQPQPRGERPGYCGYWSPATAILYLHRVRPQPAYAKIVDAVTAFVRQGAERSPEGALGHWLGSHQLWVDTLYMACPLLAASGSPADLDDAANQILLYAKRLQDPKTGLFYHMWDWQTNERSPSLWGRGNGWVLMSIADTVEPMPQHHPRRAPLTRVAQEMLRGLRATQNADGVWHTILDDPSSYPEASATAMVCYGLLKLARFGILPAASVRPVVQRAWAALNARYVRDGVVTGVSAGTDPGNDENYKRIRQGSQTWGTGAYLMAGSEVQRLAP